MPGVRVLSDVTMPISKEDREKIRAMPKAALVEEINKGRKSSFQGDKFDYLKTRLSEIAEEERREQRQEDVETAKTDLEIAEEANRIAHTANEISSKSYRMAVFSVVLALLAIVIALVPQCSTRP